MPSSSSDLRSPERTTPRSASVHTGAAATDATAELWRRVQVGPPALAVAAALTGIEAQILRDALSLSLAASPEAAELLGGMEFRVRTLKTSVETTTERCVGSVRGPILWSETITARANALGNDDVFICCTAARSFDTVENRVLAGVLETIADASRALQTPTGRRVEPAEARRIATIADDARSWRRHRRLKDVPAGRLNGRDMARLRGGHRLASLSPVMAIRHRLDQPFVAADLSELTDATTRRYHQFVLEMFDQLGRRQGIAASLTLRDGALWAGSTSFRHPRASGKTPSGVRYRGIELLPVALEVPRARRASDPGEPATGGVPISGPGDLDRLVRRLND